MNTSPLKPDEPRYTFIDHSDNTIIQYDKNPFERSKKAKSFADRGKTTKDLCPFIWTYPNIKNKLSFLSSQDIARYAMMATYICRGDYLAEKSKKPLTKKDLSRILKLPSSTFRRLYDNLILYALIYEIDGKIMINESLFFKGKIKKSKQESDYVIKVYIKSYRDLYLSSNPKEHRIIGNIFTMLCNLNVNFNVFCEDPFEIDEAKIEPMPTTDICNILKIEKNHFSRFAKELCALTHTSAQTPVFKIITVGRKKLIYINPAFVFAGRDNCESRQKFEKLKIV